MLKKILKIIFGAIIFIVISVVGLVLAVILVGNCLGIESDYCIEDGDCEEGRIVNTEKYGKVLINKKNCLKYNWEWYEKQKYCKLWN